MFIQTEMLSWLTSAHPLIGCSARWVGEQELGDLAERLCHWKTRPAICVQLAAVLSTVCACCLHLSQSKHSSLIASLRLLGIKSPELVANKTIPWTKTFLCYWMCPSAHSPLFLFVSLWWKEMERKTACIIFQGWTNKTRWTHSFKKIHLTSWDGLILTQALSNITQLISTKQKVHRRDNFFFADIWSQGRFMAVNLTPQNPS